MNQLLEILLTLCVAAGAIVVALLVLIGAVWKPNYLVAASGVLAVTTLPKAIPDSVSFGGVDIEIYALVLVLGVFGLLVRGQVDRRLLMLSGVWIITLLSFGLYGLANGNDLHWVLANIKYPLVMGLGLLSAPVYLSESIRPKLATLASASLWTSSIFVLLATFTGVEINSNVSLLDEGSSSVRISGVSSVFGMLAILLVIGRTMRGISSARTNVALLIPSAFIVLMGNSRNQFLGLIIGILLLLLVAAFNKRIGSSFRNLLRLVLVSVTAVSAVGLFIGALSPTIGRSLAVPLSSFAKRAVGGLSEETVTSDISTLWRFREIGFQLPLIAESPIWGRGFGYAYQPTYGTYGVYAQGAEETAAHYSHNFYLWLLVMSGIIGLASFLLIFIAPSVVLLLRKSASVDAQSMAVFVLVAAAIMNVSPMPIDSSSVILGTACGVIVLVLEADNARKTGRKKDEVSRRKSTWGNHFGRGRRGFA